MSLAQIGSESVWMIIEGEMYFVRELVITNLAHNFTALDKNVILSAWKIHCQNMRNINFIKSEKYEADYKVRIKLQSIEVEIYFDISRSALGLNSDIRLTASLIKAV